LTCNARPAVVVGQTGERHSKWRGRRSCRPQGTERNRIGTFASASGSVLLVASLAREQENLGVRGGVGIANPFGSIISSQGSTMFSNSYPHGSLNRYHHESPRRLLLWPSSTHYNHSRQTPSSSTKSCHRRVFSSPILSPRDFTFRLFFSTTKVCPNPLNLLNADDSLPEYRRYSLFSVVPDQGLNCFALESSRVFFVRFPELSLFQLSELLHFMDFHKKFIKVQNQFCLKP
jgi:hypothetical protein